MLVAATKQGPCLWQCSAAQSFRDCDITDLSHCTTTEDLDYVTLHQCPLTQTRPSSVPICDCPDCPSRLHQKGFSNGTEKKTMRGFQ